MFYFQDSDNKYIPILFFIALVFSCSMLFLNIIVAILYDSYDGQANMAKEDAQIKELELKAEEIGIPADISEFIIHQDHVLEIKTKNSKFQTLKKFLKSLVSRDKRLSIPGSHYYH